MYLGFRTAAKAPPFAIVPYYLYKREFLYR